MLRKIAYFVVGCSLTVAFAACNSSSYEGDVVIPDAAMCTQFSFRASSGKTAADTVFFTIDQLGQRIFNADSLPMGTDISQLVPQVTTRGASIVEFHVTRPVKGDTVYNYLEHSDEAIDFGAERVRLRIVSLDGMATCVYDVRVNVHTVRTDTLVWKRLERGSLPSSFHIVTEQHTAQTASQIFCLTRYGQQYCMARAEEPMSTWIYTTPGFDFTPDMNSLTGTKDCLYILDNTGVLHRSADNGVTWTSTGRRMTYIYGAYGDRLIGSLLDGGVWRHVEYPGTGETAITDSGFPVSGTSQALCRSFEMSDDMQMVVTGGRLADGTLTNQTWAFDGTSWARISRHSPIGHAAESMTLVPYFTVKTDTLSLVTTKQSVLMAMNGRLSDGSMNDTVYVSRDFGMNWTKADSLYQPARQMPLRYLAQGFVYNYTTTDADTKPAKAAARAASRTGWVTLFDSERPLFPWHANTIAGDCKPLATTPISQWQVPYIFLFGGVGEAGQTYNTLFRGVITYLTFKPLQ